MKTVAGLDAALFAVADPTRRRIVERLMRGPACVTELAGPIEMSLNGVSKHLKILEKVGLLRRTCQGRKHRLSLRPQPIRSIQVWSSQFEHFWTKRLDALEAHLETNKDDE